jgi:hypothetical protein
MESGELLNKVFLAYEKERQNLSFSGFSPASIDFFDDYPVETLGKGSDSNKNWMSDSKKQVFDEYLKPEFENLVNDITKLISHLDPEIEMDASKNIGSLHHRHKGWLPHYWAAIHTLGKDKRTDIQFFINLTALGLRVGIYTGEYTDAERSTIKVWHGFIGRLSKNKDEVFQELKELESKGYLFINTDGRDYAMKSDGKVATVNDSQEMYDHVNRRDKYERKKPEFDIIYRIGKEKMTDQSLIEEILRCFVETRRMYEMLQPRSFNKFKRTLL